MIDSRTLLVRIEWVPLDDQPSRSIAREFAQGRGGRGRPSDGLVRVRDAGSPFAVALRQARSRRDRLYRTLLLVAGFDYPAEVAPAGRFRIQ